MMYTTGLAEIYFSAEQSVTSTGDKLFTAPCFLPYVVRRFAVVVTTALTTNSLTALLDFRPTAGSDTGRANVATMTITTTAGAQGKGFYSNALNQKVTPGGELVFKVGGTAPAAGAVQVSILVEPYAEVPANNTSLTNLAS